MSVSKKKATPPTCINLITAQVEELKWEIFSDICKRQFNNNFTQERGYMANEKSDCYLLEHMCTCSE